MLTSVFFLSDTGCGHGAGLQGTVSHHVENIHHVVLQAVGFIVCNFLVEIHGESTASHLHHTVVNGFVSVEDSLHVSIFNAEHGAGGLWGFIAGTDVEENAQVDLRRVGLRLGKHANTIGKRGEFILSLRKLNFIRLMVRERLEGRYLSDTVMRVLRVVTV